MHAPSTAEITASRHYVKSMGVCFANDIPPGWRICGENLYARHSILYRDLPSYFMVFNIWDDDNVALSWDDTVEWTTMLGLQAVPVLYRGVYDRETIKALWSRSTADSSEGYVVRLADKIAFDDWATAVAKFVRPGHVQTDEHWSHGSIEHNQLGVVHDARYTL